MTSPSGRMQKDHDRGEIGIFEEAPPPILAVCDLVGRGSTRSPNAKCLASSLMRSLYSGIQMIFHNHPMVLFKIERKGVEEVMLPVTVPEGPGEGVPKATRTFLFQLARHLSPEPRQWVIIADAASISLRNIDHLVPPDIGGPYAPKPVDFYWAPSASLPKPGNPAPMATPGLWAVRGQHLPQLLVEWQRAWEQAGTAGDACAEEVWSNVVRGLSLRKKPFEKGEVVAPRLNALDWAKLSKAAFVTLPHWPADERSKFLQSLYLGTYLGDQTGLMLNVMEA